MVFSKQLSINRHYKSNLSIGFIINASKLLITALNKQIFDDKITGNRINQQMSSVKERSKFTSKSTNV